MVCLSMVSEGRLKIDMSFSPVTNALRWISTDLLIQAYVKKSFVVIGASALKLQKILQFRMIISAFVVRLTLGGWNINGELSIC